MSDGLAPLIRRLRSQPRSPDLAERRRALDQLAGTYPLPDDVRVDRVDVAGMAAEWSRTPGADPASALLFLHGGGFVSGSLDSHRHLAAEAARAAGMRGFTPSYRLAPEHPYPAALEDAVAAYRFLLAQGVGAARIAIAGDSAGGGLAVSTLLALRHLGLPMPRCGWCISPWLDLEASGATMRSKASADPLIQRSRLLEIAAAYLNGGDPRAPLANPLYADLTGLPQLLIQVGSAETLLDDSVRLASVAGAAGVRVTLEVWPDMIHAWLLFHSDLAEGRRAIEQAGRFIRACAEG